MEREWRRNSLPKWLAFANNVVDYNSHSEVFPYLANANDAICPLNRMPTCAKFRKAINRGANDQSPNVDIENHARVPARSLNQITRKSKSTDRNSVSRAGSAIVYVTWLQQISLSLHYAQSKGSPWKISRWNAGRRISLCHQETFVRDANKLTITFRK